MHRPAAAASTLAGSLFTVLGNPRSGLPKILREMRARLNEEAKRKHWHAVAAGALFIRRVIHGLEEIETEIRRKLAVANTAARAARTRRHTR